MEKNLSEEKNKDIQERVDKAKSYLEENNLTIAAQVLSPNLGSIDPKFNNVFGIFVQPYFSDTKYLDQKES